ncbi:MAG: hypothetical protein WB764_02860, partial [Xanthobacteraceae bacterium]
MISGRAYTLDWGELSRWDLKSARAAAFRAAHPSFRPLGDYVEEATVIVNPAREPIQDWAVYGVNNREGVFFSHYKQGHTFNAAYKRISKDFFFHNPTRANVGSLGRVPDVPPNAVTSPEYQVWKITEGLQPDFVEILIRLPFFLDLIDCHRVGAVKERLFVENLREIPIPPLSEREQRAIVVESKKMLAAVQSLKDAVRQQAIDMDGRFFADLGLKSPELAPISKVLSVPWGELSRWGVRFNQLKQVGADFAAGTYTLRKLENLAELIQYGTSEKANAEGIGIPVIRMGNI